MTQKDLLIIYRTCDKVEKFSTHNGLPRPYGSKKDIIVKCYNSLLDSYEYAVDYGKLTIDLVVVDDYSSSNTRKYLTKMGTIFTTDYSDLPFKLINVQGSGNGKSLETCYTYAYNNGNQYKYIYFIEDDYLFEEEAIYQSVETAKKAERIFKKDVVIHPVDYPDRYKQLDLSYILLGEDRHWRTIKHTTGTFMITNDILLSQWNNYMQFCKIGEPGVNEDTSINIVYEHYICLSPIPTLAEHYQEPFTLSPFSIYK